MERNRENAAARLADLTGPVGETVSVRNPDSPSLWAKARGKVAAAALGLAVIGGAGQAQAFDQAPVEGGTPAYTQMQEHLADQGTEGPGYKNLDLAGINGAMQGAADAPVEKMGVNVYPGERHTSMRTDTTTKGVGISISGEAAGFADFSRSRCAVEYNPAYMQDVGAGMDFEARGVYAQHYGAATCLHGALTERPANALEGNVAKGVLADMMATQAGGATAEAVQQGLDNRAGLYLSFENPEGDHVRKAGAVMRLADTMTPGADQLADMSYADMVHTADRITADALQIAERSDIRDIGVDKARDLGAGKIGLDEAAADAFPEGSVGASVLGTQSLASGEASLDEGKVFGYADVVVADQKDGPAQEMSQEQLFAFADTVAQERAADRATDRTVTGLQADEERLNNWMAVEGAFDRAEATGQSLQDVAPDLTAEQIDDWLAVEQEIQSEPVRAGEQERGDLAPKADDGVKHAGTAQLDLETHMAQLDLGQSETAQLDIQDPEVVRLDLKEPKVVRMTLQEPEVVNLDLKPMETAEIDSPVVQGPEVNGMAVPDALAVPAAHSELVKMASEGAERPDPAKTPWLAQQLNETVNPRQPETFDPQITKQLYTEAPEWFPAMRGAEGNKLEQRADRMVQRDYGVALKQAASPQASERLAGFAEAMPQLQDVLSTHQAAAAEKPRASKRGADMEM